MNYIIIIHMMGNKPMAEKVEEVTVTQKHPMGDGIACVAYLTKKSYNTILKMAPDPEKAWYKGFLAVELIELLKKFELDYEVKNPIEEKISEAMVHTRLADILPNRSIVNIAPCWKYPNGHYVVFIKGKGFMNPWINCAYITPAKSGFVENITDEIRTIIVPKFDIKDYNFARILGEDEEYETEEEDKK